MSTIEIAPPTVIEEPAVQHTRRYDVDWLRTLALALLIIYHATISFQSWGESVGFPENKQSLDGLWLLMGLINIWRIPILFIISGMGMRFAMERRGWGQLLVDRTKRILLPLAFGSIAVAPLGYYFLARFFSYPYSYFPFPGHLWFLGNIFLYVLIMLPVGVWFKNRPNNPFLRTINTLFRQPLGIFIAALPIVGEALLIDPGEYAGYAYTLHGLLLGFACFFLGVLFISTQATFWPAVERHRWVAFAIALVLYSSRWFQYEFDSPNLLIAIESICWMLAIFGFGARRLNRPSSQLRTLSKAVYPVYIVHLPIQYALSTVLLPTAIPAAPKLALMLIGIFGLSFALYEAVLRRIKWMRPLFGIS